MMPGATGTAARDARPGRSFRFRLILLMLMVSLVPLVLYAAVAARRIGDNALSTALESRSELFRQRTDALEQNVTRLKNTAIDIVSDTTMRLLFNALREEKAVSEQSLFRRVLISKNADTASRMINAHFVAQKDLILGISLTANRSTAPTLSVGSIQPCPEADRRARANGGIPVLYKDNKAGKQDLYMAVAFSGFTMREILGVCLIRLNPERVFSPLLPDAAAHGERLFAVEAGGNFLYRSHPNTPQAEDDAFMGAADGNGAESGIVVLEGTRYIASRRTLDVASSWTVYSIVPYERFVTITREMAGMIAPFALLSALIAAVASVAAAGYAYRPIRYMTRTIRSMSGKNLLPLSARSQPPEVALLFSSFNQLIDDVQTLMRRVSEESTRALAAERVALRAQISPHFLYNTLNVVKCLAAQHRTDDIQTAVTSLAALLRASIGDAREMVPLKEELEYVNDYVALQRLRLDLQFHYTADIQEEALEMPVPRLFLQPLVENALIHAFPDIARTDNRINVRACVEDNFLVITLRDNGSSGDPEQYARLNEQFEKGDQAFSDKVGLSNVYARSRRLFGEFVRFNIQGGGVGTVVTLALPLNVEAQASASA
ncbi:MAG TPA: sensor histidine kinase [Clostridia bacterium]|nr:sensor histidine kinase [Clostridia bacterium]